MIDVDLHDIGCDHYAAAGQKWLLAGTGTGLVYVKQDVQDQIHPLMGADGSEQDGQWVTRSWREYGDTVKRFAMDQGIEVLQPATLKDPDTVAQIAAFEPDILVVAAYGLILPQNVLDIPKKGCLNVHASLLPRWRGAASSTRWRVRGGPPFTESLSSPSSPLTSRAAVTGPSTDRNRVSLRGASRRGTGAPVTTSWLPSGAILTTARLSRSR